MISRLLLSVALMLMLNILTLSRPFSTVQADETMEATPVTSPTAVEQQLLHLINNARTQAGVQPLEHQPILIDVSRIRSNDMAQRQYFSHVTPEGTTFVNLLEERSVGFQLAGETLQRNNYPQEQTIDEAVRSLMASPPHRAILLDDRFRLVGIGHTRTEQAMNYYTIVVIQP